MRNNVPKLEAEFLKNERVLCERACTTVLACPNRARHRVVEVTLNALPFAPSSQDGALFLIIIGVISMLVAIGIICPWMAPIGISTAVCLKQRNNSRETAPSVVTPRGGLL